MRGILIVVATVLFVANVVAIAAWIYHDELQDAGWLPAAELPTQKDFALAPLPAIDANTGRDRSATAPAAPGAQAQTEPVGCVLAGSFNTRDLAVEASRRIAAQGGEVRVVANSVAADPDHLVFVATADAAAAKELVRELDAQGVSSYVIAGGERAGGVSVGMFRSEERAAAHKERVAALGHDVQLAVIDRKRLIYRVHALDVPLSALADMPRRPCDGDDGIDGKALVAPASQSQ